MQKSTGLRPIRIQTQLNTKSFNFNFIARKIQNVLESSSIFQSYLMLEPESSLFNVQSLPDSSFTSCIYPICPVSHLQENKKQVAIQTLAAPHRSKRRKRWRWFQASSKTTEEAASLINSLLLTFGISLSLPLIHSSLVKTQPLSTPALIGKRPHKPMYLRQIFQGLKKRKWRSKSKMTECFRSAERGMWRRKTRTIHDIGWSVAVASSWGGSGCLRMRKWITSRLLWRTGFLLSLCLKRKSRNLKSRRLTSLVNWMRECLLDILCL